MESANSNSVMKSPTFYLGQRFQQQQLRHNDTNHAVEFFANDNNVQPWGTALFPSNAKQSSNSTAALNEAARAPWNTPPVRHPSVFAADNNNQSSSEQQQILRQSEINKEHFVSNNGNNSSIQINYETGNSFSTSQSQIPSSSMCASSSSQTQQNQQQNNQQQKNPKLYKTELCRSWADTGRCNYGERCQYAHGENEKRPIPRHPKYKTEACQSYHKTGYCPYGPRCHFIHNEEPHVIASLIAANNAAKASTTSTRVSGSSTPVSPEAVNGGFYHQNGLRQIHSLGDSSGAGCSAQTASQRTPSSAGHMHANFTDATPQMIQHIVSNVPFAPQQTGQVSSQHQPLMLNQSVGGSNYGSNYNSHQAYYQKTPGGVVQSQQPLLQQFCGSEERTASARGVRSMPHYREDISLPLHHGSQQLPPLTQQLYKSAPLSSQPQKNSQFVFDQPAQVSNYFTLSTGAPSTNAAYVQGRAELTGIGKTTPPGSTTSADSGTESPELGLSSGSGSSATSGGFSPPGLDTLLSGINHRDAHLLRVSPKTFRRHNSLMMIGDDAFHTRPFKNNENRTSEDKTIINDDYLSLMSADIYPNFQNTLTLKSSSATPNAIDFVTGTKTLTLSSAHADAPAVSDATALPSAAEFFSGNKFTHWSNANPVSGNEQATRKLFEEAVNYPRRSSGSSLDSSGIANGGDSVGTPTSTSSSSASVVDDLWTSPGVATTTAITAAPPLGRLPIFEQLSNGPLA